MAEDTRAHYGEISGAMCDVEKKSHCQGRLVPVQKHLSTGNGKQLVIYYFLFNFYEVKETFDTFYLIAQY